MKANVGSIDRVLRIVVGVALLSLLVLVEGNAKYIGLAGLVLIGTAIFSFCPIYAVLGLKTRPDGDR
jgi:hypothetical protein